MATTEIDILGEAIIETEKEIAAEAWGQEEATLDDSGDRTIEELGEGLEGQHEPDEDDELESEEETGEESETVEQGETEVKTKPDEKTGADETKVKPEKTGKAETAPTEAAVRVPPGRLREEAQGRRAAEAERDALKTQLAESQAKSKAELDALNAKFDGVLAAMRQGQTKPEAAQTAAKPAEPPDMFEDPKGFADYLQNGFKAELTKRDQDMNNLRITTSMALAHGRHGDAFIKAQDAASKFDARNPQDQDAARRIYTAADPGEALVRWYRQNETLREVGEDPIKYKERVMAETREALTKDPEFRKQLLESLRAEAENADNGGPNTITRLPRSLNGNNAGSRGPGVDRLQFDDSDQAVAESAWR